MPLQDFRDLSGMDEHALDLGASGPPGRASRECARFVRPQGLVPGMKAERSPVAKRTSG